MLKIIRFLLTLGLFASTCDGVDYVYEWNVDSSTEQYISIFKVGDGEYKIGAVPVLLIPFFGEDPTDRLHPIGRAIAMALRDQWLDAALFNAFKDQISEAGRLEAMDEIDLKITKDTLGHASLQISS